MNAQDRRRERYCIPIRGPFARGLCQGQDFEAGEELFFCSLGSLGCTEAHGDWELEGDSGMGERPGVPFRSMGPLELLLVVLVILAIVGVITISKFLLVLVVILLLFAYFSGSFRGPRGPVV